MNIKIMHSHKTIITIIVSLPSFVTIDVSSCLHVMQIRNDVTYTSHSHQLKVPSNGFYICFKHSILINLTKACDVELSFPRKRSKYVSPF